MKYTACFGRMQASEFVPPENSVLISITDPGSADAVLFPGWVDVFRIKFWDLTEQHGDRLPASEGAIGSILDFIEDHVERNIYAHCEAGISRSGAVRTFLEENRWTVKGGNKFIAPNGHILRILRRLNRGDDW